MITSITQLPQTEFCEKKPQWQPATWKDYLAYSNDLELEKVRLFFHQGNLLIINMGW